MLRRESLIRRVSPSLLCSSLLLSGLWVGAAGCSGGGHRRCDPNSVEVLRTTGEEASKPAAAQAEAEPPPVESAEAEQAEPAPLSVEVSPELAAIAAAADRSEQDRALDAGRHPAELLALLGVQPGMRVAEMFAGTGYTAELLARAVGPEGVVYGVNSPWALQRFAEKPWSERLATPVMKHVVRLDREFDDPFPEEVGELDAVCSVLVYHDFVWMERDRDAMNAAIFKALKPGGTYLVLDHAAAEGSGVGVAKTLHRIEASLVREEVERAGFRFVGSADLWRNPEDDHSWNASPMAAGERRGKSDRFAFKFVKPQ